MRFYGEEEINRYNMQINQFAKEQMNLVKFLRAFQKDINEMFPIKEKEAAYYDNFADFI